MKRVISSLSSIILSVFFLILFPPSSKATVPLTLLDTLQRADKVDLQVLMANARVEEAIARIQEAQADLLPHIDSELSGARQSSDLRADGIPLPQLPPHIKPYNNFKMRVVLTVALFDPSAFERFKAARQGRNLSVIERQKIREDILSLSASLFLNAKRKADTVNRLLIAREKDRMAFNISAENYRQGLGTSLEVYRAKSIYLQSHYAYQHARLEANNARLDLASLLQLPLNESFNFVDDPQLMKALQQNVPSQKDRANADTALAQAQLQLQKANQKVAYADFLPKISGIADDGRLGESPGHSSNAYFVGLKASLPIWDGGIQQAHLREMKSKVHEATINLTDAKQQEELSIAHARASIIEAVSLKEAALEEKITLEKAFNIALRSQRIGTGSVLDLLQAKSDLANAQDQYDDAQSIWILGYINLLHAEGFLRKLIKQEK